VKGEKPKSQARPSYLQDAAAEYVEIDLKKGADGVFIQAAPPRSYRSIYKSLAALICGLVAGAVIALYFARPRTASSSPDPDTAQQTPAVWTGRAFYLSKTTASGGAATAACSIGFHMASIYEVLNVSTLRYDATLGLTSLDSGQGPPGLSFGWIRTGLVGDALHTCNNWTSSSATLYQGFAVRLNDLTGGPAPVLGLPPWEYLGFGDQYGSANCATRHNVWCVQD